MAIFGMDEKVVKLIVIIGITLSAVHLLGFYNMSALEFIPAFARNYVLTLLGVIDAIGAWLLFQKEL